MTDQDRLIARRYRLGETAGVGAMGIVWRARDERLRRTVAVKQLLPRPGFDQPLTEYARLRAMREARIAARLQHPNVVTVFDVVEEDGQPWLIMEYVPSRSLALALREFGPMKPYEVADIGAQAASGLAAAHAVGVVHRDVKPGNVLLGDDGTVKITDFGISRSLDDVVATSTGLVTGTPAYLAPEVASGMVPEPTSDVFALGSTLYAAVEGAPPFGLGDNPLALLNAVAKGEIHPPANGGPLTPLLMRMLQRTPGDRPTMREVQADLAELAAQRTVLSRQPVQDPGLSWTKPVVEPVSPRTSQPPMSQPATSQPSMSQPLPSRPLSYLLSQPAPDQDIAFAPASILASPSDLADDLLAIHDAALPGTQTARRRRPLWPRRPARGVEPAQPTWQAPSAQQPGRQVPLAQQGQPGRQVHATRLHAPEQTQPSRRMRPARPARPARLALVLVIALFAVGAAVFVVDRVGKGTPQAGPPGGGTASTTVSAPPTLPAGPPTFLAMTNLVTKYYGLLPGDVNDAWLLLSSQYRAKVTFDQFRAFYNTIAEVVPNNFHQVGPNTITAVINFVTRRGAVTHEPYRFTIVNRDGLLIIDNAVMVSRKSANLTSG